MADGDLISQLPLANTPPSDAEMSIVRHIFKPAQASAVVSHYRTSLLVGALACIFMLPFMPDLIERIFPSTKDSPYMNAAARAILLAIIFYLASNLKSVQTN